MKYKTYELEGYFSFNLRLSVVISQLPGGVDP